MSRINSTLQSFNLSRNQIGNECAIEIANLLEVNSTLQSLDSNGNKIENEATIEIANALKFKYSLMIWMINRKIMY